MSDRQLFKRSSVAPRGLYEAKIDLQRAGVPSGPVYTTGNDLPRGKMSRGGFVAESGGANLSAARGMGMRTAPVAMSMAGWRKARAAGIIASSGSVQNYTRKTEISRFGGMTSLGVVVDMSDMWRLAKGMLGVAVAIQRGHAIISMAINDGARAMKTGIRRKLQGWTGIRSYAETERGMRMTWSTPATMTAALTIRDRHRRIGKNFGASWSRANPGGTHSAWNRRQLAAGSFMGPSGILYKRLGKARLPIAPLWGPNMAREVERHTDETQAVVNMAAAVAQRAAVRLLTSAIAKAR